MSDGDVKKIKDIEIGDRVLGVNDYKIKSGVVTGKAFSGVKECFRLETNNNRSVVATADHRIFTQDGYKVLGNIKVGDYVVSPRFTRNTNVDIVPNKLVKDNTLTSLVFQN